jgi:protein TonB
MGQIAKRLPPPSLRFKLDAVAELKGAWLASDPHTRFQIALLCSFLLHLLVIVGVTVRAPERKLDATHMPLMVDLVNSRTQAAPAKPELLAQANLDGGGNTDAERRARSPLPMTTRPQTDADAAVQMRRSARTEAVSKRAMTQDREPAPAIAPADARPVETQSEPADTPSASELLSRSREMLQLQAQISRTLDAYQKRPRRTFIGARAQEFRFSRYIEDWRQKIERVGELNYPAAARGVYGSLLVSVEIRADGSLENVEITRSSGKQVLDEAAKRIVRLAAPFAAFPPDIAKDTDILSITRTWSFTRADQFQAE